MAQAELTEEVVLPEEGQESTVLPRIFPGRRVTEYVITDEALPADHLIFEGVDASKGPTFTISEMAKFFFGRTPYWIRWREKTGNFVLDGEKVGVGRTKKGARVYDLADIEKMAHALASHKIITAQELSTILKIVLLVAQMQELVAEQVELQRAGGLGRRG